MLQMNLWDKNLKAKWNLITVYGAAQDEEKDSFLSELVLFCNKSKEPFLVGVDFNIIRHTYEKNRKGVLIRFSKTFNCIISAYELIEIDMASGKFTWSNNQSSPTLVKLDRYLMSKKWEHLSPMSRSISFQGKFLIITH
jgi:hypothetical protein